MYSKQLFTATARTTKTPTMMFHRACLRQPATTTPSRVMVEASYLSTQTTQAMAKLQAALEDYRLQNYTQEIPTRFKKDIVSAASAVTSHNKHAATVNVIGLQHVLHNIGAAHVLTVPEIQSIFLEMGNERGEIATTTMVQML